MLYILFLSCFYSIGLSPQMTGGEGHGEEGSLQHKTGMFFCGRYSFLNIVVPLMVLHNQFI